MCPATLAAPQVSHNSEADLNHPAPDPDDPAADDHLDALQDLGDEIATLAAHIHAAEHCFLTLIAEFDRLQGWEPGGHRSCAHWLAFRTGIDLVSRHSSNVG